MKESGRKAFLISALMAMIALSQTGDSWADSGQHMSRMAQFGPQRTPMERLTPQQQEQIRQNYLRFKHLPPQERERIQKNFREWQQLPPEERERLRQRYEQMNPQENRGMEDAPGRSNPDRFRNGPHSDSLP